MKKDIEQDVKRDMTKDEKKESAAKKHVGFNRLIMIVVSLALLATVSLVVKNYFDELAQEKKEKQVVEDSRRAYMEALEKFYETASAAPTETAAPESEEPKETEPKQKVIGPEYIALRQQYNNDDIVGYLRIDGTSVDYPVVQTTDSTFYLNHDITKAYSLPGWPFLDHENDVSREDYNTIIYAHMMNSDIMFHALKYYKDKSFFEEHRYVTFNTLYENYTWEIFSFMETRVDFYYIQVEFESYDEFFELATEMKNRSMYDTGVGLRYGDRVLCLSTCTGGADKSMRYVVCARLMRVDKRPAQKLEPGISE